MLPGTGSSREGDEGRVNPLFACTASVASRSNHLTEAKSAVKNSDPIVPLGET